MQDTQKNKQFIHNLFDFILLLAPVRPLTSPILMLADILLCAQSCTLFFTNTHTASDPSHTAETSVASRTGLELQVLVLRVVGSRPVSVVMHVFDPLGLRSCRRESRAVF